MIGGSWLGDVREFLVVISHLVQDQYNTIAPLHLSFH